MISNKANSEEVLTRAVQLINELRKDFPEFTEKDIEYLVIETKEKARQKLQTIMDKFPSLQIEFYNFEPWVVRSMLINRPNTYHPHLQALKLEGDTLKTKYPSLDYKTIIAVCYLNKGKGEQVLKERFKV